MAIPGLCHSGSIHWRIKEITKLCLRIIASIYRLRYNPVAPAGLYLNISQNVDFNLKI